MPPRLGGEAGSPAGSGGRECEPGEFIGRRRRDRGVGGSWPCLTPPRPQLVGALPRLQSAAQNPGFDYDIRSISFNNAISVSSVNPREYLTGMTGLADYWAGPSRVIRECLQSPPRADLADPHAIWWPSYERHPVGSLALIGRGRLGSQQFPSVTSRLACARGRTKRSSRHGSRPATPRLRVRRPRPRVP